MKQCFYSMKRDVESLTFKASIKARNAWIHGLQSFFFFNLMLLYSDLSQFKGIVHQKNFVTPCHSKPV